MTLAVQFNDTITLGAAIVFVLVCIVAGLPVPLIRRLQVDRDEWERQEKERERELHAEQIARRDDAAAHAAEVSALQVELADVKARTDLTEHQARMQEFNETLAAEVAAQMATVVKASEQRIVELVAHQTQVLNDQTAVLARIAATLDNGGHP